MKLSSKNPRLRKAAKRQVVKKPLFRLKKPTTEIPFLNQYFSIFEGNETEVFS
jgi:hypothetical protein